MTRLSHVALVLCTLICLATLTFAQSDCDIAPGVVSGGKYLNKQLGLSYQIPEGLTPNQNSLLRDPRTHTAVILALWKQPREYDKPSVFILTDDPFQYHDTSAIGYMHRIENSAIQHHGKILQVGRRYELSGLSFYRVDYLFSEPPPPILNVALTGRVGNCELSFQATAKTQAEAEKLFQSFTKATINKK